jgi:hypothetical protein
MRRLSKTANGNGNHQLLPAKKTAGFRAYFQRTTNRRRKIFARKETEVERNYHGVGGYLRLFKVSKVLGMLALYLYLDQYDLHHAQHLKKAEARMETARKLTWLAILGEKFYQTNLAFFHD